MKDYIEDNVEAALLPLTYHILSKLPQPRTVENTKVLTSSGLSVTVVLLDSDFVYQGYISPRVFRRFINLYQRVLLHATDPRRRYILMGKPVDDRVFEFPKIYPLNNFTADPSYVKAEIRAHYTPIKRDITKALGFLHSIGIEHGDARLDNVGWNEKTGNYVLFDFDKSVIHPVMTRDIIEGDMYTFNESLQWNRS